ncbi:MAG TPA: outer membrane beta-barrel protein [Puia sp.]|nr:outer membrane beta-barrel protein [Puia sp.]
MKKYFFALAALVCLAYSGHSQNVRLNVYGNYVFNDHISSYYSSTSYFDGTVNGGFLWGGGLEFMLKQYYSAELAYLRLDTHVPINYYDYNAGRAKTANLDANLNYILLHLGRSVHVNDKVEPYGGIGLGVCIIDAKNPTQNTSGSVTKFAWDLRAGVNIWATESVGLKLQVQLLSAVQGAGGGLYFGTGGAGAGISTYSTMLQFAIGGGLTFRFGGHSSGQH